MLRGKDWSWEMEKSRLRLREDLRIEEVEDETIVFDSTSGSTLHRLTGDAVEALRLIAGRDDGAEVPARLDRAVDELVEAGIVEDPSRVSRRKALAAGGKGLAVGGAAWAVATVTTFALADPAAAATPCTSPGPSAAQVTFESNGTYVTGRGVNTLSVKAWGGGGGGGGAGWSLDGGGGGGGAFAGNASLTVSPCTSYAVTVGTGGTAGSTGGAISNGGTGGNGNSSSFGALIVAAGGMGGVGAKAANTGDGGPGGTVAASTGYTRYKGGDGKEGGGGGGGAGSSTAGNDGTDPAGGTGGTGNPDGRGGRLSHSGDTSYSWEGYVAGGGGGAGDYTGGNYYAPGKGARGEVWVGY